ncbi:M14 family zinc carboxypeptidase [Kitasatospora sp. NPDC101447]|uniref:M14 family zinc carboxypeptidase n=1 Tax=Kitasatospora sp. NPDC101447 TaxID=3364102 RepID=UPI0038032D98
MEAFAGHPWKGFPGILHGIFLCIFRAAFNSGPTVFRSGFEEGVCVVAVVLSGLGERLAGWAGMVSGAELVPSVEELVAGLRDLARREPGLCRMRQIGRSREGRPLHVLSVGSGRRSVLVVGGPHPNEPVGYATIAFLAGLVAERPELRDGVSWHFLPCVDPDGAALNSEWTNRPVDLHIAHRYFYRPAMAEQPEWTFPTPWGEEVHRFGLPEQEALADLVDELEPFVAVSLHNSEFGAPFFVASHDVPGLAGQLAAVAARQGLPVADAAPGDVVGWPVLGPGVYGMPPVQDLVIRDHEQQAPAYGAHLSHYASRHGTLTLLPEVPRWRTGTVFETSPPVALGVLAGALAGEAAEVRHLLDQAAPPNGVFARAAVDTLAVTDTIVRSWHERADATARVPGADLAEAHYSRVMLTLRTAGMAVRATEDSPPTPAVLAARARLEKLLYERAERSQRQLRTTPIALRSLVAVQACAALAAAALAR